MIDRLRCHPRRYALTRDISALILAVTCTWAPGEKRGTVGLSRRYGASDELHPFEANTLSAVVVACVLGMISAAAYRLLPGGWLPALPVGLLGIFLFFLGLCLCQRPPPCSPPAGCRLHADGNTASSKP